VNFLETGTAEVGELPTLREAAAFQNGRRCPKWRVTPHIKKVSLTHYNICK